MNYNKQALRILDYVTTLTEGGRWTPEELSLAMRGAPLEELRLSDFSLPCNTWESIHESRIHEWKITHCEEALRFLSHEIACMAAEPQIEYRDDLDTLARCV